MKLFDYQTYFIATDANHVTQHRRVVTPWFYVRLRSIKYTKYLEFYSVGIGWTHCSWVQDLCLPVSHKTKQILDLVTMVFNKGKV